MIAMILLFVAVGLVVIITTATRSQPPLGASSQASSARSTVATPGRAPTSATGTAEASASAVTLNGPYDLGTCIMTLNSGYDLVRTTVPLAQAWQRYLATDVDKQSTLEALTALENTTSVSLAAYTELLSHTYPPDQVCSRNNQVEPVTQFCLQRSMVIAKQMTTAQALVKDLQKVLNQAGQLRREQLDADQLSASRRDLFSVQRTTVTAFLGTDATTTAAQRAIDDAPQCISSAVAAISGSATGTVH